MNDVLVYLIFDKAEHSATSKIQKLHCERGEDTYGSGKHIGQTCEARWSGAVLVERCELPQRAAGTTY